MDKKSFSKILRGGFKYLIPLFISIGLCYLLFTGVDFGEMVDKIKDENNNLWWVALAMFISIFSHVFRALRWRIQLKAVNINAPLSALVNSIFGTYAVNLVFPRLGEIWRTGYISQRQQASFTVVLGSMVAERLADAVTVLLLAVATFMLASGEIMAFIREYPAFYNMLISLVSSPWLWVALIASLAIVLWVFRRFPENKILLKIKGIVKGLWEGFAAIGKMKGKGRWLMYTLLLWGCYFVQMYFAFFAFPETAGVIAQYGIVAVLVCFLLSSIAMGIPSNGGIGPWQIAVMFGLSMYGVSEMPALAFANLVLGTQTLLIILLGLYAFISISLDRKRLK